MIVYKIIDEKADPIVVTEIVVDGVSKSDETFAVGTTERAIYDSLCTQFGEANAKGLDEFDVFVNSPDGNKWRIVCDDSGVLTTKKEV